MLWLDLSWRMSVKDGTSVKMATRMYGVGETSSISPNDLCCAVDGWEKTDI